MNYVISANYLNRDSDQPWLLRHINQPASEAVPCSAIVAQNVRFGESGQYEAGFGCSKVAFAESAQAVNPQECQQLETRLYFSSWDDTFHDDRTDENLTDRICQELHLHSDRQFYAILQPIDAEVPAGV